MEGQEGGFLVDIWDSWSKTWRKGSSLISWMMDFTLGKIPWKFHVHMFIRSWSGVGSRREVFGGHWGFLMGNWEDWVILDFMDYFFTQGKTPWKYVLISLLEVFQECRFKIGGTRKTFMVPELRHGRQGHPYCHGWWFFTLRKIPWKFLVDIFTKSVSKRGGGGFKKGGTWRTLRVPDLEHGGKDHPWCHVWC